MNDRRRLLAGIYIVQPQIRRSIICAASMHGKPLKDFLVACPLFPEPALQTPSGGKVVHSCVGGIVGGGGQGFCMFSIDSEGHLSESFSMGIGNCYIWLKDLVVKFRRLQSNLSEQISLQSGEVHLHTVRFQA